VLELERIREKPLNVMWYHQIGKLLSVNFVYLL